MERIRGYVTDILLKSHEYIIVFFNVLYFYVYFFIHDIDVITLKSRMWLLFLLATPSENLTVKGCVDINNNGMALCSQPLKCIYILPWSINALKKLIQPSTFPHSLNGEGSIFSSVVSRLFCSPDKKETLTACQFFFIIKTARQGKRSFFEQSLLLFKSWSHSVFL